MAPRRRRKLPPSIVTETFEAYALRPELNWSKLKAAMRSPLHFEYRVSVPVPDSTRFALGRAAHTAIMEPDRFALDYAVWQGGRRAGAEWEAFKAAHAGHTVLTSDEYAAALGMRDGVERHPIARGLFRSGDSERTVLWTDADTGIECKARIDHWDGRTLVDLKTTRDIDARMFGSGAARWAYAEQLAFYLDGLRAVGVTTDEPPLIVAVEDEPPHDCAVFRVEPIDLDRARATVAGCLAVVAKGRASKHWPGRYPEIVPLRLPAWSYGDEPETGDLGLVIGGN